MATAAIPNLHIDNAEDAANNGESLASRIARRRQDSARRRQMESPRAGPQSPSEQQNCAQHANSSPSGGKSSAISDELEMVRRARAAQQQEASGGAGAGGADFGHASSPTDAKTTTSSGGSGKKKLAKPKPPPLAANGDAISPRQANAAAANTTPIKTLNLNTGVAASNDEWSSTSPRVAVPRTASMTRWPTR